MKRVLSLLTALSCAVLVVSGCKKTETRGGVDILQTDLKTYKRVVSLSPSSTELAALLNFTQVIGKTASCDWPPTVGGEVVMKGVKPDYEVILKMGPDAIFYDRDVISDAEVQRFKDANIAVVATDGGTTLDDFKKGLRDLAPHVFGEHTVSVYCDQIDRAISRARANAVEPAPKVAVLLPSGGHGEHMIAGTESLAALMVNNSGGQLIGPVGTKFMMLNAEEFIRMNPDVVVVAGEPASVVNDPRFKAMTAFQKKRIAPFAPGILLRRGQRVHTAIESMAATIVNEMSKE